MVLTLCQGAVFFALYLLFAGQLSWSELGVALPSAALAASFHAALRRSQRRRLTMRTSFWPMLMMKTLLALPAETLRVGRVLLGAVRSGARQGERQHQPFRPGGNAPADAGRRALVTLGVSLAPNGYVLDISTSDLLVHRLQPLPPKSDREWPV